MVSPPSISPSSFYLCSHPDTHPFLSLKKKKKNQQIGKIPPSVSHRKQTK